MKEINRRPYGVTDQKDDEVIDKKESEEMINEGRKSGDL